MDYVITVRLMIAAAAMVLVTVASEDNNFRALATHNAVIYFLILEKRLLSNFFL